MNSPNPLGTVDWTRPVSSASTIGSTSQGGTSPLYPFSISSSTVYTQGYDPGTNYCSSSPDMVKVALSLFGCSPTLIYIALFLALLSVLDVMGYTKCLCRIGFGPPIAYTSISLDISWTIVPNPKKDKQLFPTAQAID